MSLVWNVVIVSGGNRSEPCYDFPVHAGLGSSSSCETFTVHHLEQCITNSR